jgi:hypothetical protein
MQWKGVSPVCAIRGVEIAAGETSSESVLLFLESLSPPLPHLHKKLNELGFVDMVYMRAISQWSDSELENLLNKLEAHISWLDVLVIQRGLRKLQLKGAGTEIKVEDVM